MHAIRDQLAASVFRVPPERMLVSAPDVGGGFGIKNALYPEWVMLLWAARRLVGRSNGSKTAPRISSPPPKAATTSPRRGWVLPPTEPSWRWMFRRSPISALYMSGGGPGSSTNAPANAMGSGYVIPRSRWMCAPRSPIRCRSTLIAVRASRKRIICWNGLIDLAARRHGFDPADFAGATWSSEFPYTKALGSVVDCGRFAANVDDAVALADRAGFAARRALSEQRGLLRGLGLCCFMETARGAPNEGAEIRFSADGAVELLVGTQSNGQGHETTYPQIAADLLGLPPETFRYIQADTEKVRAGNGHGGARSMHMGGAAMFRAASEVIAKGTAGRGVAAAGETGGDPVRTPAVSSPASGPSRCWTSRARPRWTPMSGICWTSSRSQTAATSPRSRSTRTPASSPWIVTVASMTTARLINPLLTIGQVHGGLAQGIGQAMLEHTVYDPKSGQLLSGSLLDYALPKAADLPDLSTSCCRHTDQRQSARRQRRRPGGGDGRAANDHLRHSRCARPLRRHPYRHARDTGTSLARDPDRPKGDTMSQIAAEEYLDALAAHGIEHLFVNPGTDFAPIVEAYARAARTNRPVPTPMVVPHENAAVGMAHGYTMVTGKAQAVMLHTNVGTANSINMLIDASRDRVPDAVDLRPHALHRVRCRRFPQRPHPLGAGDV